MIAVERFPFRPVQRGRENPKARGKESGRDESFQAEEAEVGKVRDVQADADGIDGSHERYGSQKDPVKTLTARVPMIANHDG